MPSPTREYVINHSYGTARALLAYVERAAKERDEGVLASVRPVIDRMIRALAEAPIGVTKLESEH